MNRPQTHISRSEMTRLSKIIAVRHLIAERDRFLDLKTTPNCSFMINIYFFESIYVYIQVNLLWKQKECLPWQAPGPVGGE